MTADEKLAIFQEAIAARDRRIVALEADVQRLQGVLGVIAAQRYSPFCADIASGALGDTTAGEGARDAQTDGH